MKTKMNFRPVAKMSIAAVTLLVASATTFVNASELSGKSAFESLDQMNMNIEESILYKAPETADTYYMESAEAAERLEAYTITVAETLKYQAPVVTEDVEEFEYQAAMERLENFHLALEESIKF